MSQGGSGELASTCSGLPRRAAVVPRVPRSGLRRDALAGLTVWAVLVPESLAYATIAGVPPVVGLYAAVPALLLYALLGSSRHMVVATMSATAALSASIVGVYAAAGSRGLHRRSPRRSRSSPASSPCSPVCCASASSPRSSPSRCSRASSSASPSRSSSGSCRSCSASRRARATSSSRSPRCSASSAAPTAATLVVGLVSLAIVLGLRRWLPVVPGSLVAVLVGIAAVPLFDLVAKGVAIVGPIEAGLPTVGLPQGRGVADYLMLVASAAGVVLIAFAEGLAAAKTYADKDGYDIDPNQELIALGAANVGCRADLRDGRERQPVQDRGQRLGGCPQPALGGHRRDPRRRHPAVPHRAVREPARGHARRSRHRRGRRARQRPVARPPLPRLDRAARRHLRLGRARRLHRRARRAARRPASSTSFRGCSSASASRCCC